MYKNGLMVADLLAFDYVITSNLVAGNIYQISVSAYNDVGESLQSDQVDIMAARVPNAPTSVSLVKQTAGYIEISWVTPDNGGTPLKTYNIYHDGATNGATFSEVVTSTGLVNQYIVTSVVADSVY